MFNVKIDVDGLEEFKKYIEYVKSMNNMKIDKNFQKFIQNKCLEVVKKISDQRITNTTTNDEYIEEYKMRHSIRETENGFVLYNDFTIPYIMTTMNTKNQDRDNGIVRDYSKGFSIALAFEYGVGLVGKENAVQGAWEYNKNNYGEYGWYYKPLDGKSIQTRGYEGFEVYRFTAEEISKSLKDWVMEYKKNNKGGVRT